MTDRYHITRAIGAALGQRAAVEEMWDDLTRFRAPALAPARRDGLCTGEVIQNLDRWISRIAPVVRQASPPRGVPPSVGGGEMAVLGGTGTGETWRHGVGYAALMKCLHGDIADPSVRLGTDFVRAITPLLALAHDDRRMG